MKKPIEYTKIGEVVTNCNLIESIDLDHDAVRLDPVNGSEPIHITVPRDSMIMRQFITVELKTYPSGTELNEQPTTS